MTLLEDLEDFEGGKPEQQKPIPAFPIIVPDDSDAEKTSDGIPVTARILPAKPLAPSRPASSGDVYVA